MTKASDQPAPLAPAWARYSEIGRDGKEVLDAPEMPAEPVQVPADAVPASVDAETFANAFVAWVQKQKPPITAKDLANADVMTKKIKQFLAEVPMSVQTEAVKALTNG